MSVGPTQSVCEPDLMLAVVRPERLYFLSSMSSYMSICEEMEDIAFACRDVCITQHVIFMLRDAVEQG